MKAKPFHCILKGLRIPFVAAWDAELPDIRHCPTINATGVFTGDLDHRQAALAGQLGKVLLGQMAPQRQRYVMAFNLCQVCGEPLLFKVLLGHPEYHGPDRLLAFDEPPCCARCALVAIELCPYARKGWAQRGGLVADHTQLFTQLAKLLKGDDRAKFAKSCKPLPRPVFRRWLDKPLGVHVRMVPVTGARIEGDAGLELLRKMAEQEGGPW